MACKRSPVRARLAPSLAVNEIWRIRSERRRLEAIAFYELGLDAARQTGPSWTGQGGRQIILAIVHLRYRQEEGRCLIAGCFAVRSMGTATATGVVRVSSGLPRRTVAARRWSRATSRRGTSRIRSSTVS